MPTRSPDFPAMTTRYVSHTYCPHGLIAVSLSPITKQTFGLAVFGLFIAQIVVGAFIHFIRIPFLFVGHRPPQNYIHAIIGLTILAMAASQVRLLWRYH
jgi:hypothetical protein